MTASLELVHTQAGFDLFVDPRDFLSVLLIRDGIFEAAETDLLSRVIRPGDTCIDAGCHLGYYSCLMGRLVGENGRVYSFDANPQACQSTRRNLALNGFYSAEVFQTAVAESTGSRRFYVSTDDQTGLSSLGAIPIHKQAISVPCIRLDAFLKDKGIDKVRLLKMDVEGAEEIALQGLGHRLAEHGIDFILVECFDERLQLMGSSTEAVSRILQGAGYSCWEFDAENPAGWVRTTQAVSRGDCNYLFASPAAMKMVPTYSLGAALRHNLAQSVQLQDDQNRLQEQNAQLRSERDQLQKQSSELQEQNAQLRSERDQLQKQSSELQEQKNQLQIERDHLFNSNASLRQELGQAHDDNRWLLSTINEFEARTARLEQEKRELADVWERVQGSTGWRLLNKWRRLRDRLAPESSWFRKLYDSTMRKF
jgi:FkbM family methyltransferase